jgi:hypothetical protein
VRLAEDVLVEHATGAARLGGEVQQQQSAGLRCLHLRLVEIGAPCHAASRRLRLPGQLRVRHDGQAGGDEQSPNVANKESGEHSESIRWAVDENNDGGPRR